MSASGVVGAVGRGRGKSARRMESLRRSVRDFRSQKRLFRTMISGALPLYKRNSLGPFISPFAAPFTDQSELGETDDVVCAAGQEGEDRVEEC
jgi:hypothetical protein